MGFAINDAAKRWPNGCVPYRLSSNTSDAVRQSVEEAVDGWNQATNVNLFEVPPGVWRPDCILFTPGPSDGTCRSPVGRQRGTQTIRCSLSGKDTGTVMHEIGHALGLFHEHQRPDRGKAINIHHENIIDDCEKWYDVRSGGVCLTTYDTESLMHYDSGVFRLRGRGNTMTDKAGNAISRASDISPRDAEAMNRMYLRHPGHLHYKRHMQFAAKDARDWYNADVGLILGSGWHRQRLTFGMKDRFASILYGVYPDGSLYWYRHDSPDSSAPIWRRRRRIGGGWQRFSRVIGSSDGVIYAIEPDGDLYWYRHMGYLSGSAAWHERSGTRIGTGWNQFGHVFSGGHGVLYGVTRHNTLRIYRHRDHQQGTSGWHPGAGNTVNSGLGRFFAFDAWNSRIYALDRQGGMTFFVHSGQRQSSDRWFSRRSGTEISRNWRGYARMVTTGRGRLYAMVN